MPEKRTEHHARPFVSSSTAAATAHWFVLSGEILIIIVDVTIEVLHTCCKDQVHLTGT